MTSRSFVSALIFSATFIAASFVQVRVRADVMSLPVQEDVSDDPVNCFAEHHFPCALKTMKGHKFRARFGRNEIVLGSDSSCLLGSESGAEINEPTRLLRGEFLVFTEGELDLKIPSGTLHIDANTNTLIAYNGERTLIRPISGEVHVKPLVAEDLFSVFPGQENWLGRVRSDHHVAAGLPLTTNLRELISKWAILSFLEKDDFKERAAKYREVWELQREETAKLLKDTVQENVATVEAQRKVQKVAAASEKRERAELKKMLWENTFGMPMEEIAVSSKKEGSRKPASTSGPLR